MSYWHARVEQNGKRLAGSDRDAIEANTAADAARIATRFYWIERRQLFERVDDDVREITVAIGKHLSVHPDTDTTTATPIGELSRWTGTVFVKSKGADIGRDFDADDCDRTEAIEITVTAARR